MSLGWRTVLVAGAWFVMANAALSLAVWTAWPLLLRGSHRASAAARARLAFVCRLLPTTVSLAAAAAGGAAFLRHEPVQGDEPVGVVLFALGGAAAALLAGTVVRTFAAVLASERLARAWTAHPPALELPDSRTPAWAIDVEFPVVAVVGIWRPRLVVARSVVEHCTPEELAAIAAHERAHLAVRDNLRKLLMQTAVDGLSFTTRQAAVSRFWQEASEDAADDRASASGARSLDLASALVTVARLAPGLRMTAWPAAACFYRGDGLERRVRRLLDHSRQVPPVSMRRRLQVAAAVCALTTAVAAAVGTNAGRALYAAGEWMVQRLP